MANKKISTDDVEVYKTNITNLATEVSDAFTSITTCAKEIDNIAAECGVESDSTIFSFYEEDPSESIEMNASAVRNVLEQTLEKAQKNDTTLKEKMMERSDEINILKGIISQYKAHAESPTPTSSLAEGLSTIGKANFIDRIPGVIEGRQKRVEAEIDANILFLSDEDILAKIKANYRNLSDEDIQVLMQYYKLMNLPEEVKFIALNGQKPILMNVDGHYVIEYGDSDFKFKEELMKGSASLDLNHKLSAKKTDDGSVKISDTGAS